MPEAVLLQDVESLGERGSVVEVSKGYLRNYLIPRKLAAQATPGLLEQFVQKQQAAERAEREAVDRAEDNAAMLGRTVLTIARQAGSDGRLYGSVTAKEIVEAIRSARGVRVDRHGVHLPEPIRNVGTYMVVVDLPAGHTATVKTMVVAASE
ncbi:MAG: 50S ribosomal protein L9 [Solirubrobacteraceae bacterium]